MTESSGLSRRTLIKAGAAAAVAGAVGVPAFNILRSSDEPILEGSDDPIVFIIIDDWMSFASLDRYVPTLPEDMAIDRWTRQYAQENLWFRNAHTPSTACASARPAMLWGIPPHESGVYNNQDRDKWRTSPAYAGKPSIVREMREAGWNTHGFGKIFHPNFVEEHEPNCWDSYQPHVWLNAEQREAGGNFSDYRSRSLIAFGPLDATAELMPDHAVANGAIEFLRTMGQRDIAFIGLRKPHVPLRVPQEFYDQIDADGIVFPESGDHPVTGVARFFLQNAQSKDIEGIREAGEWRDLIHSYLAAVRYADYEFGRIIREVPASARVILTSDHGFALGERGAFAKTTLWDQSTAVPLVVGGIGQKAEVRTAVSLLDIPSTIQGFAGLPVQNESLVSIAERPNDDTRAVVTTYRTVKWAQSRLGSAVRRGDYQLIVYDNGVEEMYDVRDDPWELENIADLPEMSEIKRELYEHMPSSYAA